MPAATPSALANTVMGKLYDVLTNGDDTVPPSDDNFFTWCTPGVPVDPTDFEFLTQGLTGVVKKRDVEATNPAGGGSPPPPPNPLTPAQINQLRAQDTTRLFMQAEGLARLVDFVPDVTEVATQPFAKLNVMNNEGSLSDIYEYTLRMSQVVNSELDDATKQQIAEIQKVMTVTTVIKGMLGSPDTEVTQPGPLVRAYNEKMAAYMSAALEYNCRRIDALVADNPRAVQDFAINANIYRLKVKAAMSDWETLGYKNQYERAAAFMEQVQARNLMLLKAEYKDALEKARLTGLASGSDFFYTSLVPGTFATSAGWTKFTFNSGDFNSRSHSEFKYNRWSTSGGGGFLGIFGGRASHSQTSASSQYNGSFDSDTFGLSFEICQVPIVRPWFKSAFLVSKGWRFDPSDLLNKSRSVCDGGKPPKGTMPAYPTSVVFIRNLKLTMDHSQGFSSYASQYNSSSTSGGGYVSFGPIFLGGSAGSVSTSGSTDQARGFKFTTEGMEVPGMQIIGYKCHVLPKCPDPIQGENVRWA